MNWNNDIQGLQDPAIKRIRTTLHHFTISFEDKEVPLSAPIPKDTGFCRRPLQRDYLVVVGKDKDGRERTINCGLFSNELLEKVQAASKELI